MPDDAEETVSDILIADFSAALENVTARPLEGCDACRACAMWQLRNKDFSNPAQRSN